MSPDEHDEIECARLFLSVNTLESLTFYSLNFNRRKRYWIWKDHMLWSTFSDAQGYREWSWQVCDQDDQCSERHDERSQNHIVSTNKIMPENLYNLSLGHSIAVGVALDPGSHFPESMGKKEIDSLFKIVGEFMESEKMPEESIKSFMLHLTKRMKALSEKVEDAKKRKQKKPVRPVSFHEVERHPRVWRRHWRENEQHE